MKYSSSILAAALLALTVSPLVAQQEDAPAPPAVEEDAPVADAPEQAEAESTEETAEAPAEAPAEEAPAEGVPAENTEPAEVVGQAAPAQAVPAQRLQVVQAQQLVARANGAVQFVVPGAAGGVARSFSDDLAGLPELEMCAVTDGVTRDNDPSSYRFEAEGPGLLTVAVRAKNRDDMTIEVYNEGGHQLARCDIDFGGNTGAEHLAIPLPEAGSYRVVVEPLGSGGAFWIGASFLPFEAIEAIAPASPDDATEITPGQPQDAAVAAAGPVEQWFTFTAPSEGILVFNTATGNGDLVIEAYANGDFQNYFDYSDQDRNGSTGNERILLEMVEGQEVYFKVRPLSAGQDIEFNVRSQFVDTSE
ncbi:MAG: PPC domain-containing protein [Planctomycetota bacterium]